MSTIRGQGPEDSVHVLISTQRPREERAAEAARLGLGPRVRMIASTAGRDRDLAGPSTVVASLHGVLRATIVASEQAVGSENRGAGAWGGPEALPRSWAAAVLAFRLAQHRGIAIDFEELGVVGAAALALEDGEHPDVEVLSLLDARSADVLATLVGAESVRAAAASLGMHHSSVQRRHESFTRELGYDPRSPLGRARYELADILLAVRPPNVE